jgi:hypothetical protein
VFRVVATAMAEDRWATVSAKDPESAMENPRIR